MTLNRIPLNQPLPHWIVLSMSWLFVILFAVWLQPNTVFVRHSCMVIGALLGLYVISIKFQLLLQRRAIPILMILLLLLWVTIHLFFFSQSYDQQLHEYTQIWKKIALTIPFGVGLGLALNSQFANQKNSSRYWSIIYFGFLAPSLVYFVKYAATRYYGPDVIGISKFLFLSPNHLEDLWGVSRAAYVFFCMPAFAISVALISVLLRDSSIKISHKWVYLLGLILPASIFFIENDRTGVLYCILILLFAIFLGIKNLGTSLSFQKMIILAFMLMIVSASTWIGLQRNEAWKTLAADVKLAIHIDKYNNWQHPKTNPPPTLINEMGLRANESNYDRAAWLVQGVHLTKENPLGYGLMTLSFGHLNLIEFPDSQTSLSHSAWLDFTLGYGFIGVFLLLGAACLVYWNGRDTISPWGLLPRWVLGYWILLFLTKELSMEIFVNTFVLGVVWCAAMSCQNKNA